MLQTQGSFAILDASLLLVVYSTKTFRLDAPLRLDVELEAVVLHQKQSFTQE